MKIKDVVYLVAGVFADSQRDCVTRIRQVIKYIKTGETQWNPLEAHFFRCQRCGHIFLKKFAVCDECTPKLESDVVKLFKSARENYYEMKKASGYSNYMHFRSGFDEDLEKLFDLME